LKIQSNISIKQKSQGTRAFFFVQKKGTFAVPSLFQYLLRILALCPGNHQVFKLLRRKSCPSSIWLAASRIVTPVKRFKSLNVRQLYERGVAFVKSLNYLNSTCSDVISIYSSCCNDFLSYL